MSSANTRYPRLCRPLFTALIVLVSLAAGADPVSTPDLDVDIHTSMGHIIVRLDPDRAPRTVENFLHYVRDRGYDSTIFHRVISDFMIQGGGYSRTFDKRSTRAPVVNEADNGLKNLRGTIAMARTRAPNSATNQFFINNVDNPFLDHRDRSPNGWGYAVFGHVVEGMDVVDRISAVATGPGGPFARDVPREPVVIEAIRIRDSGKVQQRPEAPPAGSD